MFHGFRMFRNMMYYLFRAKTGGSNRHLLDESVQNKMCLPFDLDNFLHMNNARYLQHCDIARIKLWFENDVWRHVFTGPDKNLVVGASIGRYRRAITLFEKYQLRSKVIYWDDTAFYVEHQFVRSSDNFVCYVGLIKQSVVGIKTSEVIDSLGYSVEKPEPLPELEKWISSINLSSERLRNMDS